MSQVYEKEFELDWTLPPAKLNNQTLAQLAERESAVRCVFGAQASEIGIVDEQPSQRTPFAFRRRPIESHEQFNVVYVVPTGVGAAQGGHAGDATPVLKAISAIADHAFTHPNVVNASDVNELPENALYIEGSLLSAFLMGTIKLKQRRENRVLVLIGQHDVQRYIDAAVNTVNSARSTYGMNCTAIALVPITMEVSWSPSGRASGIITGMDSVFDLLEQHRGTYDSVAITSAITIDSEIRDHYLEVTKGESVNPWGGVEAMLTHAIATQINQPVAHAPMMPSEEVEELDYGVVDARVAAEMISLSFFQCVLKGLQKAPVVTTDANDHQAFSAADVNAIVIPRGCFGLPIYAALHQGIRVIAVADKIYAEDQTTYIRSLPWQAGQYTEVRNYKEALGVLACWKAGVSTESTSRPLRTHRLRKHSQAIVQSVSHVAHSTVERSKA